MIPADNERRETRSCEDCPMSTRMSLVLGAPGEAEVPLLADLGARPDVALLAVIDPTGECLGASIAEIMGLPVLSSLDQLAVPNGDEPSFVLPAGPPALTATLAREAEAAGMPTTRAEEIRARLAAPRPTEPDEPSPPGPATPRSPDLEAIERESRELQASLADLEDALAGDTIMRRLLALCTRAVGASGGSIMLFDEASRELYIAYATGLSEGTLHGTRVKLGEGISGRVALTREAELVEGRQGPESRHRDRPNIASAICTPLHTDDRLLGVLNVSSQQGEPFLTTESRDVLAGLADRLSRILNEVLQLQRQRTSRMFHVTEQQLRRVASEERSLPEMLTAWTSALALTAEADRVGLVVPCEDGNLLVAESTADQDGRHGYEPLHNPAWTEVLGSGLPLVARQEKPPDDGAEAVTVFYLPIGRNPVRAGLAVQFTGPSRAHAFHAIAGETVFLLDRLLPDLLAQRHQSHRGDMLARLSRTMSGLTGRDATPGALLEDLCEAIRDLTGARYAVVIAELGEELPRLAGGNAPEAAPWLHDARRLLEAAVDDGWRITTLETPDQPLSVMALTSPSGTPTPGILLVGKERTHELDGAVFTPLDAELILPLASMLPRLMPPPATPPRVAPGPAEEPTEKPASDTGSAAPEPAEPPADPDADLSSSVDLGLVPRPDAGEDHLPDGADDAPPDIIVDTSPLAETFELMPTGALLSHVDDADQRLVEDLTREMDRCDRYHNVCGLVICKPEMDLADAISLLERAARALAERMRISDRVYTLPTGELVLLVPEDVRNLEQLQERICDDIRGLAGDPELVILRGRAAYPTVRGPADRFLATIRKRLRA
ncbi:GAF domain-containing protein [bacterium]|nr:GAF domain-containing protein [bacterium]